MTTETTSRLVFLAGTAIDLVLLEKRDALSLTRWINDQTVTQFLSRGDTPFTQVAQEERIASLYERNEDITLGIWHREDQKLIGSTGLHQINSRDRHATFGILIGEKEYWSNGYGTDVLQTLLRFAFEIKGLRQVLLDVLADNLRAVRCYEKCGFAKVGSIPQHIFKTGSWHDLDIMLATSA